MGDNKNVHLWVTKTIERPRFVAGVGQGEKVEYHCCRRWSEKDDQTKPQTKHQTPPEGYTTNSTCNQRSDIHASRPQPRYDVRPNWPAGLQAYISLRRLNNNYYYHPYYYYYNWYQLLILQTRRRAVYIGRPKTVNKSLLLLLLLRSDRIESAATDGGGGRENNRTNEIYDRIMCNA